MFIILFIWINLDNNYAYICYNLHMYFIVYWIRRNYTPFNFGGLDYLCPYCGAHMWYEDRENIKEYIMSNLFHYAVRKEWLD